MLAMNYSKIIDESQGNIFNTSMVYKHASRARLEKSSGKLLSSELALAHLHTFRPPET
jgi:hypothetical protein